jgi:hypothetical protein
MTMDVDCGLKALEQALGVATSAIFDSDQGSQFTSTDFTRRLEAAGVNIRMDGRGRVLDHVFVERLWRTVKDEEVYLQDYRMPREAIHGFATFFQGDNTERPHQALGYQTPAAVSFDSMPGRRSSTSPQTVLTMGDTSPLRPIPPCPSGLLSNGFALLRGQLLGAGRAALLAPKFTKGHGGGVLVAGRLFSRFLR